ncbi:Sucrase/ferredoxin-like-domain-containing protein [Biscogniauxia mediterranea]|nr:Sucrase/ferredoxin-like-domain-containing protein [Biscogniauxia mediterranea]
MITASGTASPSSEQQPHSSSSSPPPSKPKQHRSPPLKQKMALGFKSLLDGARKLAIGDDASKAGGSPATTTTTTTTAKLAQELFPPTDPAVDGEDCVHDCDSCHVHYPRGFKVEQSDMLYGNVGAWSTHVLVATGKSDWVRDVEDEKGSVMEAFGKAQRPSNGKMKLSASNMPTPSHTTDYSEPTTILLLPAFTIIENVTPAAVPTVVSEYINRAPTTTTPLGPVRLPRSLASPSPDADADAPTIPPEARGLVARPCPHRAVILLCSQRTRDARCGQSAPLLRKELERHLRPLGLHRDPDDERPGGVAVYFVSHVGGHKYSANVIVYRRPDAFGVDAVRRGKGEEVVLSTTGTRGNAGEDRDGDGDGRGEGEEGEEEGEEEEEDVGAAQCIWLARVRPEDCENIVKYTVLQGKVVKPDTQLRGGFDRAKGLLSW